MADYCSIGLRPQVPAIGHRSRPRVPATGPGHRSQQEGEQSKSKSKRNAGKLKKTKKNMPVPCCGRRKQDCRCYDSGAGLRLKESFKRSVFDTLVRAIRKSRMRRAGQMRKAHRSIPNGLHVAAFLEPAPLESLHGKQSLHGLQKDGGQLCIPPSLWVNADYRPFTHRLPSY